MIEWTARQIVVSVHKQTQFQVVVGQTMESVVAFDTPALSRTGLETEASAVTRKRPSVRVISASVPVAIVVDARTPQRPVRLGRTSV